MCSASIAVMLGTSSDSISGAERRSAPTKWSTRRRRSLRYRCSVSISSVATTCSRLERAGVEPLLRLPLVCRAVERSPPVVRRGVVPRLPRFRLERRLVRWLWRFGDMRLDTSDSRREKATATSTSLCTSRSSSRSRKWSSDSASVSIIESAVTRSARMPELSSSPSCSSCSPSTRADDVRRASSAFARASSPSAAESAASSAARCALDDNWRSRVGGGGASLIAALISSCAASRGRLHGRELQRRHGRVCPRERGGRCRAECSTTQLNASFNSTARRPPSPS